MDGAWIARGDAGGCQSDAVRPPPVVAPPRPGRNGGNQMNDNLSQFYHSFGRQEKHPTNVVIAQDSTLLTKINLVHSEPCNPEANNLFLSGSSHHSQCRSLQLPNPMCELPVTDPPFSDFSVMVRSLSSGPSGLTYPRAVDVADYNGHRMGIESNDLFTASSQQSQSIYNQSFVPPESIEAAHSPFSPLSSCNPGGYKTFHGNGTAVEVPSTLHVHNTEFIHASVNLHPYSNAQITSKNASEMKSTTSDHASAYKLGAPRVFCMGTVGEIFLNEKGFFGVICLCHSLRMSVAKFCEHSGSPFVNPGEAVRLDNGQTIAQWRRLFFWNAGIRIADDNIGWDWPDCTITSSGLIGSKFNNCKYPKFHESSQPLELSGGSTGRGILSKNYTSLAQPNMGHPLFEKLLNRTSVNVPQKSAMLMENSLYKGCSGSLLQPSNNLTMQEVSENHCYDSLLTSKSTMNNGKQNAGWQFLAHQAETGGKDGNFSVGNDGLLSRAPSASSNFKLSLRQPSHQSGNFMETTAHEQLFNLEKQHLHEPVLPISSVPSETRQSLQNLQCDHSEKLESRRSILQYESTSDINSIEEREFNGDLDKNSSISLFLSYLNTFEGNASIHASEGFLSSTENPVSKLPNVDSYHEDHDINMLRKIIDGANGSLDVNEIGASYLINKGKGVIVSTPDGSYPLLRPDSGQNKRMAETKKPTVGAEEHPLRGSSRILLTDTDTRNFDQSGESFCTKNCKQCKDLECLSRCRASFLPPRDLSLDLVQTSNGIPLPSKRITDAKHCMLDGNMGFHSQKDMAELSNWNYAESSSDKAPHQGIIYCPLAIEMQRKGLKEDLISLDKWRHGYCCLQHGSSESMAQPLPYHKCHCTATVQESADKNVLNESCYDAITTSRIPFCSRGHTVQHKHCCAVSVDESHLLRCHGIHNDKSQKNNKYDKRACNKPPECLSGCCYSLGIRHSDACREHTVGGSTQTLHSPDLIRDCMKQDASALSGCDGFRRILPNNKDSSTVWRDVPGNMKQDSYINYVKKPEEKLQVTDIVEDQDTDASTEFADGAFLESEIKERQMSNCCSGLSAPLAEVSVEFTDTNSYNSGISSGRIVHDLVDEGSGIEKCGSSEVTLDTKVDSLKQSYSPTKIFNTGCSSKSKKFGRHLQAWKTQKAENRKMLSTRLKRFDASNLDSVLSPVHYELSSCTDQPEQQSSTFKEKESLIQPDDAMKTMAVLASKASGFKRKGPLLACVNVSSSKSCKNWGKLPDNKTCNKFTKKFNKAFSGDSNISSFKGVIRRTKDVRQTKYISLNDMKLSLNGNEQCTKRLKPVVCGNSGIISNGDCSQSRPLKMFSLRAILKNTRKPTTLEEKQECDLTSKSKTKKTCSNTNSGKCKEDIISEDDEGKNLIRSSRTDNRCFSARKESVDERSVLDTEQNSGRHITLKSGIHQGPSNLKNQPRPKEVRKRSLDELIGKANNPCTSNAIAGKGRNIPKCLSSKTCQEDHRSDVLQLDTGKFSCKGHICQSSIFNSDAFCCVCGSPNKDDTNHLIECSQCFIKVHQACYGILRVPKGYWYCRPCRANSIKTACVLCGYEGGAMTRAVKCQAIVRSILKAWKFEASSKFVKSVLSTEDALDEGICTSSNDKTSLFNEHHSNFVGMTINIEMPSKILSITDTPSITTATERNELQTFYGVQNSIISGFFDPSITQWVHMVCGLWTPGTRCPNVDTMNTFDVSGALISRKNMVCSMCNRPGGSCIKCRVVGCSAYFHPWCAHQKGLLQSEIEGIDNENVGFYGRCSLHASLLSDHSASLSTGAESPKKNDFSCARIVGYKRRKMEKGLINHFRYSDEYGRCIVPQEQINTWLYINGQKLCARAPMNPPCTETESDCLKEYARYKQSKSWKQLVVYKSGIHALGLYTSLFIPRGAMVVEYVGEIVGLRVADKREIEYQSGNKLQYKSACYFFRIDKDNIIDATCKGGIARFVNHSCLPNCVAKVISVRNERKVVFFAERDLYPGEEITYDYNFTHEDEGNKIPCFCNSKNCRRYLN